MNTSDDTIGMAQPPISSTTGMSPQETLLQRGAFDPPATPGTLGCLERFEILRLLGEGGMGLVYLAREPRTDTRVAIKIVKPRVADDPHVVHRFLTEARHMYRLAHPRILRVLEVSDRKESPYYVMPYIEGGSLLGQYNPDHSMSTEQILSIAPQVAEALAYAHAHGLIHRDLKPANVLLDKDGNAYLTDFGLVRTVFNDSMVDASASHLEGTAPYMSPAVARGEAEDTRCDIYAFGALLYELLTGQPPYTGRTPQMILDQIRKGPPTPIRKINPKASPALIKIAEGCMERELRDRYAAMTDVVKDFNRAALGKAPLGPRSGQGASSVGKWIAATLGVLVLITLAAFGISKFSSSKTSDAGSGSSNTPKKQVTVKPSQHQENTNLTLDLGNNVTLPLVFVPPGSFMLGSTTEEQEWAAKNGCSREMTEAEGDKPQNARIRQGFWLGKTEVTVGQWKQFVNATRYQTDAEKKGHSEFFDGGTVKGASWRDPKIGFALTDNHPACYINWNDAVAFCTWLTEQERKDGRLPSGFVFRLPTEAEWEYACRAGTQTRFWWGDTKEAGEGRLNWTGKADGFEFLSPVDYYGDRGQNRFGLADILGNVAEWCLDDFDPTRAHEECFKGNAEKRTIRGGAHDDSTGICRCAFRFGIAPNFQNYGSGFRVCFGALTSTGVSASVILSSKAPVVSQLPSDTQTPALKQALISYIWVWVAPDSNVEKTQFRNDGNVTNPFWTGQWKITGPREVTIHSESIINRFPNRTYKDAVITFNDNLTAFTGINFFDNAAITGLRQGLLHSTRLSTTSAVTNASIRHPSSDPYTTNNATIKQPAVSHRKLDQTTGLVVVPNITDDSCTALDRAMHEFSNSGIKNIVLDFRNNGGGSEKAARDVAGLFLGTKLPAYKYRGEGQNASEDKFGTKPKVWTGGVVVLVNEKTASMAELVATACRLCKRGKIIGQQTFGKSAVHSIGYTTDKVLSKIKLGEFRTANDEPIEGVGVKPDIEFTGSDDQWLAKAMSSFQNP